MKKTSAKNILKCCFKTNISVDEDYGQELKKRNLSLRTFNDNFEIKCPYCNNTNNIYIKDKKPYCIFHAPGDAINKKTRKPKKEEIGLFVKELKNYIKNNIDTYFPYKLQLSFETIIFPCFFNIKTSNEGKNTIDAIINNTEAEIDIILPLGFNIDFYYCVFEELVQILPAAYNNNITFHKCEFNLGIIAENCKFQKGIDLSHSKFKSYVSFSNSIFEYYGDFSNTTFKNDDKSMDIDFSLQKRTKNEQLYESFIFKDSYIYGAITFRNRRIEADFSNIKFFKSFDFSFVQFYPLSRFYNMDFLDFETVGMDNCYRVLKNCMNAINHPQMVSILLEYEKTSLMTIGKNYTSTRIPINELKGQALYKRIEEEIKKEERETGKKVQVARFIKKFCIKHSIKLSSKNLAGEYYRYKTKKRKTIKNNESKSTF